MAGAAVVLAVALSWRGWGGEGALASHPAAIDVDRKPAASAPPSPVVRAPPADAAAPSSTSAASPAALMAEYRDSGGRSHARHAGKRLILKGAVLAVESGENGLVMLSLDAGPDLPPARAVMASAYAAPMRTRAVGRRVALDCAARGLLMGEPLLADCRVLQD